MGDWQLSPVGSGQTWSVGGWQIWFVGMTGTAYGTSPDEVLVVVNKRMSGTKKVAKYYMERSILSKK